MITFSAHLMIDAVYVSLSLSVSPLVRLWSMSCKTGIISLASIMVKVGSILWAMAQSCCELFAFCASCSACMFRWVSCMKVCMISMAAFGSSSEKAVKGVNRNGDVAVSWSGDISDSGFSG